MKLFYLTALLMLVSVGAYASEERSFMLAMDYSSYVRMAQNDTFNVAKEALTENPYAQKKAVPVIEKTLSEDDEKWNTVKDFKKTKNLSGGGFVNTTDRVAVGAFAGYQFDEINEDRLNEAYSLTINVNIAL